MNPNSQTAFDEFWKKFEIAPIPDFVREAAWCAWQEAQRSGPADETLLSDYFEAYPFGKLGDRYRALKNAAPQVPQNAPSVLSGGHAESPARASSEAVADDARDAARYRWLRAGGWRSKEWPPSHFPTPPWCICVDVDRNMPSNRPMSGAELDAAIDPMLFATYGTEGGISASTI